MNDKTKGTALDWLEFIAKYVVIIVSALWILGVGTDFVQKQTAELEYRNLKLGKNSVPIAKQSLDLKTDNEPWIGNEVLCTVSGQYVVTNEGILPFQIDKVTFQVYEIPLFSSSEAKKQKITSRTLSVLLKDAKPILVEDIAEPARVGTNGKYSRSFQYVINRSRDMLYTVVANASGAVIGIEEQENILLRFGPNELKIASGASSICGGDATLPKET